MSRLVRMGSESAFDFDHRIFELVEGMARSEKPVVSRDASVVYAEGVLAGLQLAVAALQRKQRVIDHISRWESRYRKYVEAEVERGDR